jgi:hypothetical protein
MARTYQDGLKDGRKQLASRLLDVLAEIHGTTTDKDLSDWVGVAQASLSQWRSGIAAPQRAALKTICQHLASCYAEPEAEIEPVSPGRPGAGWHIDSDATKRADLKARLEHRRGVYLFYDSRGHVTYVGQAKSNLFFEIEQRLAQVLRHGAYTRVPTAASLTATDLVQGNVVGYLSAYITTTGEAAHNLEAILIRAFANNHQNRKSAKIRLGDWEA